MEVTKEIKSKLTLYRKIEKCLILFRLICFFLFLYSIYYFWSNSFYLLITVVVIILCFFLSSVFLNEVAEAINSYTAYINLIEVEDKEYFHNSLKKIGNEYIKESHPFANDLDIFGENSLFAHLNRTSTIMGKNTLSDWLLNPLLDTNDILERQSAFKELLTHKTFIKDFRINGIQLLNDTDDNISDLLDWIRNETYPSLNIKLKWLLITIISINTSVLILTVLNIIPFHFLVNSICIFGIISLKLERKFDFIHEKISKGLLSMNHYAKLLEILCKEDFKSNLLNKWQYSILNTRINAIRMLQKGNKIGKMLDQRKNLMLHFLFEGMFGWQIIQLFRIEKWKNKNKNELFKCFEIIGLFDAAISICLYIDKHPSYCFPVVSNKKGFLYAKDLGNPLIYNHECVTNDFSVGCPGMFLIITGANMAGKSTYLRTIGINLIMAGIGAPVYASSFIFSPCQVMANLKTSDSLSKQESYFFAELKKLRQIVNELDSGKQLFILLDEILKGTNSNDKLEGSKSFIKKMVEHKSNGILATHDTKLGDMELQYPNFIINYHFSSCINNGNLLFDYKLKPGIVSEFNATFLMQQMGII